MVILAVDPPAEPGTGDWPVISRMTMTMTIVDGPGDAGFPLPRLGPAGDLAPPGWDDAVDRGAGSHVVFGTGADDRAVVARSLS